MRNIFFIIAATLFVFCVGSGCQTTDTPSEALAPDLPIQELYAGVRIPKIDVTTDGTLLAFGKSGGVVRRSTDGGQTWGDPITIGDGAAGTNVVDQTTGDILIVQTDKGRVWRSRDQGNTWASEEVVVHPNAAGHGAPACNPAETSCSESGIALQHGNHKGRLLVSARIMPPHGTNDQEWWPYHYNTSVFSDDGGKTWQTGYPVQTGTGEGALAEMSNGDIYYNSRSHLCIDHRRQIS